MGTRDLTVSDISAEPADSTIVKDADFVSNGFLKRTAAGVYTVDGNTYLTQTEVDARVLYETLDTNGDVGSSAGQLAIGNHNHSADYINLDGSTPLTAGWDAGPYGITARTFISDVVTGTIPINVASTTRCTNLNADLLDGNEATAFALDADFNVSWIAAAGWANSWVSSSTLPVKYRRTGSALDVVQVRGRMESGTAGNVVAFVLPSGYRPDSAINILCPTTTGSDYVNVQITATGEVRPRSGTNDTSTSAGTELNFQFYRN